MVRAKKGRASPCWQGSVATAPKESEVYSPKWSLLEGGAGLSWVHLDLLLSLLFSILGDERVETPQYYLDFLYYIFF